MTQRVHLAVALQGAGWHPAAWRESDAAPTALTSPQYWTDLVRTAETAGVTFVTIEDALEFGERSIARTPGEPRADRVRGRLDAVLLASFLAPRTRRIGLVPTVTTTHPEPFHLATGLQTLDHASGGRAGARIVAGSSPDERANFGRRTHGPTGLPASGRVEDDPELLAAFREAGEVAEAIRGLADSWEDDAIVRDVASGRFLDRERVHNLDLEGEFFSIAGASIVPRSPQGQPLITALAHQAVPYAFAAAHADVVFITPADATGVAPIRAELDTAAHDVRTDSEALRVFADVVVLIENTTDAARDAWARLQSRDPWTSDARIVVGSPTDVAAELNSLAAAGVDGVRVRPARLPHDLVALADLVVPLASDVLVADDGARTLRERLGLPRRASRYAREAALA